MPHFQIPHWDGREEEDYLANPTYNFEKAIETEQIAKMYLL